MRLEGPVSASSIARVWNLSFRPGEWLLSRFSHLDQTRWPILWVIGLFMVQAVPATILRASNLEEGRIIAIARGAMEDGHWITPFVYGERFAERPVLLSWIAALFGEMTGGVTLWSLRIPHLVFFLSGAILIYSLLRSNAGSKSASIFGALCWLSMPMVAPKFINAEADVVLSTLLFAAFYTWWQATISKHLTLLAWLGIGVLNCGPHERAAAGRLLRTRRRRISASEGSKPDPRIPRGKCSCSADDRRLVRHGLSAKRYRSMDGSFAAIDRDWPRAGSRPSRFRRERGSGSPASNNPDRTGNCDRSAHVEERQARPDACSYALLGDLHTVSRLLAGGVATRYAMPATMTLAVICGIMFDDWRHSHPRVIVSALVVSYLIFAGLLVRGWVAMPFWPHLFKESQIAGNAISSVLQRNPGPLYVVGTSTEHNMLGYVRGKIRAVTIDDMARLKTSAVAVLFPEEELALIQKNPEMRLIDYANIVSQRRSYRVVVLQPAETR